MGTQSKLRPHERLTQTLRERISSGIWQVGEMIPARRALAQEYGVALATVGKAVHALIAEGYLRADDRRGTFVASLSREDAGPPQGALRTSEYVVGLITRIIPYDSLAARQAQWNSRILHACEQAFSSEEGVTLNFVDLVREGQSDLTMEEAIAVSVAAGAQAIVYIGGPGEDPLELLMEKELPPAVCVTLDPIDLPIPQVYIDSSIGGALAVRHLRQRGFEQLIFLRPFITNWVTQRLQGVQAAVAAEDLQVFPKRPLAKVDLNLQPEIGGRLAARILAKPPAPKTGIIAPNDLVARGFMEQASTMGFEAGRDYGILGFDDRQREVQLTSLRPPLEQMGQEAARLAMLCLHRRVAPSRVALPHSLIARASTKIP